MSSPLGPPEVREDHYKFLWDPDCLLVALELETLLHRLVNTLFRMLGFASTIHLLPCRAEADVVCRRPRSTPRARAEGTGKKKKVAPLQFALDQKGRPVWSLRRAQAEDVPALIELGGEVARLGPAVLTSICEDHGCLCCEASVKGTKAGSGYEGRILGGAVADVTMGVRDPKVGFESGLVKRAEILGVEVSALMEGRNDVKRTLTVGLMKSLKAAGVILVTKDAAEDEVADFKDMGFKITQQGKRTQMSAALATINPDPKKRIS